MKITILSLFNTIETHGVSNVVREHIEYLRKKNYKIQLIEPSIPRHFSNRKVSEMDLLNRKIQVDFRSEVLPLNPSGDFTNPFPFISLFRTHQFNPDIIHAHEMSFQFAAYVIYSKLFKKKIIVSSHQSYKGYLNLNIPKYLKFTIPFLIFGIKLFFNKCDAVLALSENLKKDLVEMGIHESLIKVIPNGVNQKFLPTQHSIKYDSINLITIGNWERRKNQQFLIDVMKFLPPQYNLKIIGHVHNTDYFYEAIEKIGENNLFERVQILGKIPSERIYDFLKNSDVFLFSSKIEAQSLVILEALASGIPIMMLKPEQGDSVIEDNENGFLMDSDTDPQTFAIKLMELTAEKNYSRFNLNNMNSSTNYNYENILNNLEVIYKEI